MLLKRRVCKITRTIKRGMGSRGVARSIARAISHNRCPGCPLPRDRERGDRKIPCSALRAGLLLPWCVAVLTGSVAGMSRTIDSQDRAARSIVIAGSQWVARSIGGLHGTDVCQHVNRQQWGIGRGINRQIKIGRDREGSGDRSQDQHGVRVSSWPVQVVPIPGGVDQGSTDRG